VSLFIAENRLEEALVKAVKNPATLKAFYSLLLDSELLVMGTVAVSQTADGKAVATPGSQFQLETAEKDGTPFLPVFTSLPRMQAFAKKEVKYLSMPGRALLDLTRGVPVILNPGSEFGREFTAAEVARLLDPTPRAAPVPAFGEADYPQALVDGLSALFQRRGDVVTAWMIQHNPSDVGAPVPLVGIETTADMADLMADIETMAQKNAPGLVFDVQRVDRLRPAAMAQVLMQAEPFFIRALPGRILN
jgi:hypothetical protein